MLKNEIFFHQQTSWSKKSLGFSVIFVPPKEFETFNEKGDIMVWVANTKCNRKDKQFNKKIARAVLRERAMELIKVRDVPKYVANLTGDVAFQPGAFYHLLRHFV